MEKNNNPATSDDDGGGDGAILREIPLTRRALVLSDFFTGRGRPVAIPAEDLARARRLFARDETQGTDKGIEQ